MLSYANLISFLYLIDISDAFADNELALTEEALQWMTDSVNVKA